MREREKQQQQKLGRRKSIIRQVGFSERKLVRQFIRSPSSILVVPLCRSAGLNHKFSSVSELAAAAAVLWSALRVFRFYYIPCSALTPTPSVAGELCLDKRGGIGKGHGTRGILNSTQGYPKVCSRGRLFTIRGRLQINSVFVCNSGEPMVIEPLLRTPLKDEKYFI